MKKYYEKLKGVKLFAGLDENSYGPVLTCLYAKIAKYKKGFILQLTGDHIKSIGIVLDGCIEISRTDCVGNRLIVNRVEYPAMFGEALAFAGVEFSPVTLMALEDSAVLHLDLKSIVNDEVSASCRYHKTIITNMLKIMAQKSMFLSSRLELVTKKTTRSKLAAYLLYSAELAKCANFEIPYNRNQLADYLSVNRSAMSNELCKMRKEGILDFQKNRFTIHKPMELSEFAYGRRERQ